MGQKPSTLASLPDGTGFYCVNRMEMLFCYREIFEARAYENPLIKFADGDVVLDVGANIGLFLLYVSRRCSGGRIFAFEPIPRIFDALSRNAHGVDNGEVRLFCCGISDRPGEATFTFLRNVTARSTMYPEFSPADESDQSRSREQAFMLQTFRQIPNRFMRWGIAALPGFMKRGLARGVVKFHGCTRKVVCPLKTLSQIIEENSLDRVDLLKVDVEGAERDVLRGVREDHWQRIQQLIVETHPGEGDVAGDVRTMLETRGFRTVMSDQTLHPAPTIFAAR